MRPTRLRRPARLAALLLISSQLALTVAHAATFEPAISAESDHTIAGTVSNLSVRVGQKDRGAAITSYRIAIRPTWRLAFASLRNSTLSSCAEMPTGDAVPYSQMEAIGFATLQVATDDTRNPNVLQQTNQQAGSPVAQIQPPRPARYSSGNSAALWFLNWDPDARRALVCGKVRSVDVGVSGNDGGEVVFQLAFTLEADGSWTLSFDFDSVPGSPEGFRSLTDDDAFVQKHVTVIEAVLSLSALSGGNYNLDPQGKRCLPEPPPAACQSQCDPCRVAFSQTPTTPVNVVFAAEFTSCGTDGCETLLRESILPITLPPSSVIHDFGKLTGPAGPSPVPSGYGIIRGTNNVTFGWTQPEIPPTGVVKIKGYLLTIAVPGQQDTRHFEHIVTDPDEAGFDVRTPCGADGKTGSCSLTLTFPLSTVGSGYLSDDGKYAVSLLTIYQGAAGGVDRRTDGLCDNGTGDGIACPVDEPAIRIIAPGMSTWEFLIRSKAWPRAFIETRGFSYTGCLQEAQPGGCSYDAPWLVLLVDFELKQGEFVVWNPYRTTPGPANTFFAASNSIVGHNTAGGMVSFGSPTMTGHTANWAFEGVIGLDPSLVPNKIVPCSKPGAPLSRPVPGAEHACGTFTRWDLKGLPGAIPPGGLPTANVMTFAGSAIT